MNEEEDYSSLSLPERAVHKVWKVRCEAYEEIAKTFASSSSEYDECFQSALADPELFRKMIQDSNKVAQEQGINAVNQFLEFGGSAACLKIRSSTVKDIIEKGLSSTRAGTKAKSIDSLLWFIELDTPQPVIDELIPFLSHKMPKLVASVVTALVAIIESFGAKTVAPQPITAELPKLFSHSDKNVRAETAKLCVELYKWLGDALEKILFPELKPVQQKDLLAAFEAVKGETPQQKRFLRSQQEAMERQAAASVSTGSDDLSMQEVDGGDNSSTAVDVFDLAPEVDVLSKIPPNFYNDIASPKWQERKTAIEELANILDTPKVTESADYMSLVNLLAKLITKDANIHVSNIAAGCVKSLASALRTAFSRYAAIVLPSLLERTREKKQAAALEAALDAVFTTISLTEVLDLSLPFISHKIPNVRIETAKFLVRCLKITPVAPNRSETQQILAAIEKNLNDAQEPVRSSACEVVGTLMKITGERELTQFMEKITDASKKAKIKEFCDKADVRAKQGAPAVRRGASNGPAASGTSVGGSGARKGETGSGAPPRQGAAIRRPLNSNRGSQSEAESGNSNLPAGLRTPGTQVARKRMLSTPGSALVGSSLHKKSVVGSPVRMGSIKSSGYGQKEPSDDGNSNGMNSSLGSNSASIGRSLQGSSNTGRSLTNRTLGSGAIPSGNSTGFPAGSNGGQFSANDRAEIEQLRSEKAELLKEKEKLMWQNQEQQTEKTRLLQEVSNLQAKVDRLTDEHTRDILAIKAKETQLARANTDIDAGRMENARLQLEVERLKTSMEQMKLEYTQRLGLIMQRGGTVTEEMLTNSLVAPTAGSNGSNRSQSGTLNSVSPPIEAGDRGFHSSTSSTKSSSSERLPLHRPSGNRMEELEARVSNINIDSGGRLRGLSSTSSNQGVFSSLSTQQKENVFSKPLGDNLYKPIDYTAVSHDRKSRDEWKRATEVTSQLKERIEKMRAGKSATLDNR